MEEQQLRRPATSIFRPPGTSLPPYPVPPGTGSGKQQPRPPQGMFCPEGPHSMPHPQALDPGAGSAKLGLRKGDLLSMGKLNHFWRRLSMPQFILVENGVQKSTARSGNAVQCPSLPFGSLTTVSCFRTWPCKALLAQSTIPVFLSTQVWDRHRTVILIYLWGADLMETDSGEICISLNAPNEQHCNAAGQ